MCHSVIARVYRKKIYIFGRFAHSSSSIEMQQAVLFLLLGTSTLGAAAIDWGSVPPVPPESRNLENAALGACPCDLTSGHCDVECCCDPDCTPDMIKLFDSCLPEPTFRDSRSCVDGSPAVEIFRINHADVQRDSRIPAENAVCVVRNNYPNKMEYFSVPSSPVIIPTPVSPPPDWFVGSVSTGAGFRSGDQVSFHTVVSNAGESAQMVSNGGLNTFSRGAGGICSSVAPSRFMYDERSACILDDRIGVENTCRGLSQTWVRAILRPNSPITTMAVVAPVRVEFVSSSGDIVDRLDPHDYFQSAIEGGNVSVSSPAYPELVGGVCMNAPIQITTRIEIHATGSSFGFIASVNQTVVLANISSSDLATGVTLGRTTEFVSTSSSQIVRRSGNPGYVRGFKVPAGVLLKKSAQEAIQQAPRGLVLPVGDCFSGSWNSVRFLSDVRDSHCSVSLNMTEFKHLCGSGTQQIVSQIWNRTLESSANSDFVIAQTGDSDWRVPSSWIPVEGFHFNENAPLPFDTQNFQCNNIVVGMSFEILVGRAGSVRNPQDIIVGARADPIYGTWTFQNEKRPRQRFAFRTTVQWKRSIQENEATLSRRIIAPPILPSVNENIFFPFRRPG